MDTQRLPYDNSAALQARNLGIVIYFRLFIALPLLALAAGCAANDPLMVRAGGSYVEEIKSPLPRDQLLFGPNCIVR